MSYAFRNYLQISTNRLQTIFSLQSQNLSFRRPLATSRKSQQHVAMRGVCFLTLLAERALAVQRATAGAITLAAKGSLYLHL